MVQQSFVFFDSSQTQLQVQENSESEALPQIKQVRHFSLRSTNSFQQTIPLLNKDHKHYTPSFILEEEENFYK